MLPVSKLLAKGILMLNLKNKVMKFLCRNLIWIMIKIKLVFLVLVLGFSSLNAKVWSQQDRIDLVFENMNMVQLFEQIQQKTNLKFVFNQEDVQKYTVSGKVHYKTVSEILDLVFVDKPLRYEITSDHVVIFYAEQQDDEKKVAGIKVKGTVTDEEGIPLPGVTVMIKWTTIGTATDIDGKFNLEVPQADTTKLIFTFVGMQNYELRLSKKKTEYNIVMKSDTKALDDVVVTGIFTKKKNSFTGAVKSMTVEEIKAISPTNIVSAISMLTPGLRLIENNQAGSNPNRLPEVVIRGTSSLSTEADQSANQPLIILDGVEISMRDLYDIDVNDIERVDVLKDASATAMYGERAANGVIVIERKRVLNDQLRLTYNLEGSLDVPDLKSYDYLNAEDKLEFERLAGLYNFETMQGFEEYNRKKILIAKGMDTDWMSQPLRSGFIINNSIGVSGRGSGMTYRMNANVRNVRGVMKKDYRNTVGLAMYLSYHVDNKVTVFFQSQYSSVKWKESPFGNFSDYVIMNPYDAPYDEYGKIIKTLSWDMANPLFEAQCGNYNKGNSHSFTNTLSFRWDVVPGFFINGSGTILSSNEAKEGFISPESNDFIGVVREERGSLDMTKTKTLEYTGSLNFNYSKSFGDNTLLTLNAGGEVNKREDIEDGYQAIGFYKPNLNAPNFAAKYPEASRPSAREDISTRLGVYGGLNFIMRNKYFVDGSFRRSGSSKFGENNKYAPFWSVGAGWNIHNEWFMKRFGWVNTFRLRYSYGVTGEVKFAPYQAVTTYFYHGDNYYLHGMGTLPKTMGNEDLTWQSTGMHNLGLNLSMWNGRLDLTLDAYIKTTEDMLIDMSVPPSVGESTVMNNLGRMRNKGIEFDVTGLIVNTKNWRFSLKVNGAHNTNKILAISNALLKYNNEMSTDKSVAPKVLYQEGESETAIYAVRSAGINPATGEEVFIKKNGAYTLVYDSNDKVVVGDETPVLEGAILPMLSYKGWSLNLSMMYRFGGQVYNLTRAINVENVNPRHNVDRRAFDERWKKVNDIPPYLDIANADSRTSIHTSRFVEDDNTLEVKTITVAYEFNPELLKSIGFKRLRVSVGMNDPFRLSTIKYERGTSYPFSRGFVFSISPTF
ncbi:MAG TPA: SusC/RagA family TonB-linked outer membrane protein [Butyricimonas virosa]|nr:SusC/RagA family TonB-linked outer membrane protein [Butyricimonas virosa]